LIKQDKDRWDYKVQSIIPYRKSSLFAVKS